MNIDATKTNAAANLTGRSNFADPPVLVPAPQLSLRSTALSTASWLRRATGRSELKGNTMKTTIAVLIALTAGLSVLQAQSAPAAGSPKASAPRAKASPPLVVATLDANHDGVIDAGEIANASQALKSLDKNADGKLTGAELRRPRPTRAASPVTKPRATQKRSSAEGSEVERR